METYHDQCSRMRLARNKFINHKCVVVHSSEESGKKQSGENCTVLFRV